MTHGNGAYDKPYTVRLADRLTEIAGDLMVGPEDEVSFFWRCGYEELNVQSTETRGGLEYAGTYHPDGFCVGPGVCAYCGRTLFDD